MRSLLRLHGGFVEGATPASGCAVNSPHSRGVTDTPKGYRCVATSPDGFVQQVVRYISGGHYFYFTGKMRQKRDPAAFDAMMIEQYGVDQTPWTRCRRRQQGHASTHYLRHEDFFILMASAGRGPFYEAFEEQQGEAGQVIRPALYRDIRRVSLIFDVYAIKNTVCQNTRVQNGRRCHYPKRQTLVRLNREANAMLKAHMLRQSTAYPRNQLEDLFWSLGFHPYRPVISQLYAVLRAVNRKRLSRGMTPLRQKKAIRQRRRPVEVFA